MSEKAVKLLSWRKLIDRHKVMHYISKIRNLVKIIVVLYFSRFNTMREYLCCNYSIAIAKMFGKK